MIKVDNNFTADELWEINILIQLHGSKGKQAMYKDIIRKCKAQIKHLNKKQEQGE